MSADSETAPKSRFSESLDREARIATETHDYRGYSEFLANLIFAGRIDSKDQTAFAARLAKAELSTTNHQSHTTSEGDVIQVFNAVVGAIAPTSSIRADPITLHAYRLFLAKNAPNSMTAGSSETLCTPTESVLLLFFLLADDGSTAAHKINPPSQPNNGAVAIIRPGLGVQTLLNNYLAAKRSASNKQLIGIIEHGLHF